MKAIPLVVFFCFLLLGMLPVPCDPSGPLAVPHPELYQHPTIPIGKLGLPLGTFAVIKGTVFAGNRLSDFTVETINGFKPDHEVDIQTDWSASIPEKKLMGKCYVLHGYEIGGWKDWKSGFPNRQFYAIGNQFVVTSVEKMDGVTTTDAKPVDLRLLLSQPKFETPKYDMQPIGILGLPLGTFAVIKARPYPRPILLADPFEIDMVNGKPMSPPLIISIPGVKAASGTEFSTLRGFEAGEWASQPTLPSSEGITSIPQQPFQFFPRFIVTSPTKADD